ncbi:MAG: EAL domain-containing protein [Magnetospirillum sp.]|nr:EAL domain-containing protein [Magnetospirillum sp.]
MVRGSAPGAKTVLIVEDNPGDSRLVQHYLREGARPVQARIADTLAAALGILAAEHIDAVLLDLSLPDSFGIETLERLRSAHPLVPVVVLTGTNDEGLALEALRRGAQDYLVKGVGDSDLVCRSVHYAIERSRVDQELRRSEARFRAVFANAGVGVVLIQPDGHFVEVNRAFSATLGYGEAELKAMTIRDLVHPEDVAREDEAAAEMADGKRDSYTLQQRYRTRDGRIVWGRITVTAVRDEETQDIRFLVGVMEDVTDRKRLEDHLRLSATVFENTGEGLFITDAERRIIHVNRAFTEITGYQPEDVLGRNPSILASGRHGPDFYARMWQALDAKGKWQGEIWDRRKSGEMFAGWQNIAAVRGGGGGVVNYVAVISDITSRKEVEERLSYAANHDPLTRLPNRTLFQERLSRALARAGRSRNIVALLFIDLDRFKLVNDTFGHLAGDMLLQQVAERVNRAIRQGDTVARLSGDEFVVILEDLADPRDSAMVAQKILRLLAEPFDLDGRSATISSSIGVALYPADAGDAQSLVKLADEAMYKAKRIGRNNCQFHSEIVSAQAFERMALESALRGALERREFELYYQPVFDARSGATVAVEALLRWRHPAVGMVVPSQFLPLAEETGLIVPIGRWVLEEGCRQANAWRAGGNAGLKLAVNLSARQLHEPEVVEWVAAALEASGLPPENLIIEIPESSVVDMAGESGGAFARLAALGINLTIDEFGSGYSSFTFLRRLPANALKISQTFVHNLAANTDDAEIVSAIVAVARGLHMAVVGTGIETEEQFAALTAHGAAWVQGFLFAYPMPADRLTEFLAGGQVPEALAGRAPA